MNPQWMLAEIELLRKHLYTVADKHQGDLLHPQVLEASQALDVAIERFTSRHRQHPFAV